MMLLGLIQRHSDDVTALNNLTCKASRMISTYASCWGSGSCGMCFVCGTVDTLMLMSKETPKQYTICSDCSFIQTVSQPVSDEFLTAYPSTIARLQVSTIKSLGLLMMIRAITFDESVRYNKCTCPLCGRRVSGAVAYQCNGYRGYTCAKCRRGVSQWHTDMLMHVFLCRCVAERIHVDICEYIIMTVLTLIAS